MKARMILPLVGLLLTVMPSNGAGAQTGALSLLPQMRQQDHLDDALCRQAVARLGAARLAFAQRADVLAIATRSARNTPQLSGTLAGAFARFGSDWCTTFEIDNLDHASLQLVVDHSYGLGFRGSGLPPLPVGDLRAGRTEHRVVTDAQTGVGRAVSIYRPSRTAEQIVILLDVNSPDVALYRRVDDLIARGLLPPLLLVGIAQPRDPDMRRASELRLAEFTEDGAEGQAFDHFIFATLLPTLARETGLRSPERLAIVGESAGATWSLRHAAAHRTEASIWGAFALPNGTEPTLPGGAGPTLYMGGGTFDLDYLANGLARCAAIRRGGGDCHFSTVEAAHDWGAWDELIIAMLLDWTRNAAIARMGQ